MTSFGRTARRALLLPLCGLALAGPVSRAAGETLVSLGDSCSSGEAAAPYDADTDDKDGIKRNHKCHRSPDAWPRLLGVAKAHHLACSGATIEDLDTGQVDRAPDDSGQVARLQAGGTATQTFAIPPGVAFLDSALVQIDPDSRVTAHASQRINGAVRATATAAAAGDTRFAFPAVGVSRGDHAALSIRFTATFGKIITVYSAAAVGGTLTISNSRPDGAPSLTRSSGLRAVVSGWNR